MSEQEAAPGIDFDKVTGDLRDAARQDMAGQEGAAPPQPTPDAPQPDQGVDEQPPSQEAVDSFMNIDPATLPPELQAQYRNMQADYTRKMQEVSQYRNLAQQYGVSAEEMAQAVDFVGRIQSDPAYTQQVYTGLGEYLQQMGYREPQAAPAPMDNELDDRYDDEVDPYGESPTDTPAQPRRETGTQLEYRLAQVEQMLANQESQAYVRDLANQIKQDEFAVRETNPDWGDADIQRIYELAPTYDGNLVAASEAYKGWRSDILQSYLASKAQAPLAGSGGGTAAAGTEPQSSAANLREATLRAEEALNRALGD